MASSEQMYIASVVLTYWFVSISMVYLNKMLMSNEGMSIPAPLFVTWYQCVITMLICWIAGKIGERARKNSSYQAVSVSDSADATSNSPKPSFFAQFPRATYEMAVARRIFPLSVVFVGMITFNNLCLKWVEVSFYNVARSLTIVFNVFFTHALLGISSSFRTIVCLLVVIVGFFIGGYGEINFSLIGTIAGVMSSLFVSLNSIFTKKVLPVVDDNHWRLTFYNNVNATFLFIPLVLYFEGDIISQHSDTRLVSGIFWTAMTVAGVFGFSIGIVTVLQIKATSPLTHNISGTAKAAVQSLMAFYIWGNEATFLGVLGIFTVLGGSLLYTVVKMGESRPIMGEAKPAKDVETGVSNGTQAAKV
uniref:Sugar phosphate transporter domain-containing protein n=1 Tax=Trieres chinensis TaxID=1514140 RepID=A0A7S2EWA7_TRICV|mmetsp:Transcript_4510/g.9530  ORF Transcript_4510/g.9530 Transcript_4510/m.9530 type:complete len:362 (+) Transcript_4510:178-1263(+)|eukprot:CAMPEP_0183292252 /NCGR_PEP_ID=MMETSP0160_2-20130417/1371_1 /TAXON_ID=2839 ORGANISM="Odontella Sinensis, Strain Grunow 1884" /NCGR_SAMPLE_ID=MMETSP0160_2 /ASSEMBLY_ACC=CAM_ASM_000250 /LENGTH=361 /DNA_ID=CAMNT_0025453175 /DNA_START=178 /DNA_END=1263 /DNA_ORIENTATION=+